MRREEGKSDRNPLERAYPTGKNIKRGQRGEAGGDSITLLGNEAIIKGERETYREGNSWC